MYKKCKLILNMNTRSSRKAPMPMELAALTHVQRKRDRAGWFTVKQTQDKGKGVFASRDIDRKVFLMEYGGELISNQEGVKREDDIHDHSVFRYFFEYEKIKYCIDATAELPNGPKFGRMVNHGDGKEINSKMVVVKNGDVPALCLFSNKPIKSGSEILYDYGIKDLPWKKSKGTCSKQTHGTVNVLPGDSKACDIVQNSKEVEISKKTRGTCSKQTHGTVNVLPGDSKASDIVQNSKEVEISKKTRVSHWHEKLLQLKTDTRTKEVDGLIFNKYLKIADGSNGSQVFIGCFNNQPVAVKRVIESSFGKDELSIHNLAKNMHMSNVLKNICCKHDEDFTYLATPLCEYNLAELIEDKRCALRKDLTLSRRIDLCIEFLTGLKALHDVDIVHRDIKPQNVLLDKNGNLMVSDFGVSRKLVGMTTLITKAVGSMCWMSKESICSSDLVRCKKSSDIQMAGCLLYFILSDGHLPHEETSPYRNNVMGLVQNIQNGKFSTNHLSAKCLSDLIELMICDNEGSILAVDDCLQRFKRIKELPG